MKIFLPIIIIRNKHTNKMMMSFHYRSNKQTKQKIFSNKTFTNK